VEKNYENSNNYPEAKVWLKPKENQLSEKFEKQESENFGFYSIKK